MGKNDFEYTDTGQGMTLVISNKIRRDIIYKLADDITDVLAKYNLNDSHVKVQVEVGTANG